MRAPRACLPGHRSPRTHPTGRSAGLLALALATSCACRQLVEPSPPPAAAGPPVRGYVLSPGGAPVAGATVLVENIKYPGVTHGNWTATTGADGYFETPLTGPGYFDAFVTYPFVDFERWTFPGVWFDAVPDTLQPRPLYQNGRVDFGFDASVQLVYGRGELSFGFGRPGAISGVGAVEFRVQPDGTFTAAVPGAGLYGARFTAFHGGTATAFRPDEQLLLTGEDTLRVTGPLRAVDLDLEVGGQPAPPFHGQLVISVQKARSERSRVEIVGAVELSGGRIRVWTATGDAGVHLDPGPNGSFIAQTHFFGAWPPLAAIELGAHRLEIMARSTGGQALPGVDLELTRSGTDGVLWRSTTGDGGASTVRLNNGLYGVRASLGAVGPIDTVVTVRADLELVLSLPDAPLRIEDAGRQVRRRAAGHRW